MDTRCGFDNKAMPAERGLSSDIAGQPVWKAQPLQSSAEHKSSWMKNIFLAERHKMLPRSSERPYAISPIKADQRDAFDPGLSERTEPPA